MGITKEDGPLAPHPAPGNYTIDGPPHRIAFTAFPRRLRAELGGETVIDTTAARLLHETAIRARLYVPLADVRSDLLRPSDTGTHCPFKGDASYRTVAVGERVSEDALWVYDDPNPETPWLRDHAGVYEERFDRWLDEEEEVIGHVRDPFTRVDVVPSSRHVRVEADGEVVAESTRTLLLSETGLPNRFYLPREDVSAPLERSAKAMVCPYKGHSTYWSLPAVPDAAWSYEDPLDSVKAIAGHISFDPEVVTVIEV
jgi:uncharacterized protein (DUF427 family)